MLVADSRLVICGDTGVGYPAAATGPSPSSWTPETCSIRQESAPPGLTYVGTARRRGSETDV
ncbi:hypothetical protein I546_5937 [Mycobacterium kansasii 732]|nr:hypothetical protein I546_5937 [Mycobacterium kansasii 732]